METIKKGILRISHNGQKAVKIKLEFLKKEISGEVVVFVNFHQISGKAVGILALQAVVASYPGELSELNAPWKYRHYRTKGISGRKDVFCQILSDPEWGNTETYRLHESMYGNYNEGFFYPLFSLVNMLENEIERLQDAETKAAEALRNFKEIATDDDEDIKKIAELKQALDEAKADKAPYFSQEWQFKSAEEVFKLFEEPETETQPEPEEK